ncbi:DUF3574 domain-containing protein [Amycolatopsis sp. NPDC050768]|uniref:DUF3574 domain-containing protein n=1 Tax=Amycolatopsis sp. NPDC050768 TaxID=3154839 RepID=UPI0033D59C62
MIFLEGGGRDVDFTTGCVGCHCGRGPGSRRGSGGTGQYRIASGEITREHSIVLVILYPFDDRDADTDLEQIRTDYKKLFHQESVLRTDSVERGSF